MEYTNGIQHQDEENFDVLDNNSENMEHENSSFSDEDVLECEDSVESDNVAAGNEKIDECNCCEAKEKEMKLRERLRELSTEYERLKNIMLERLLQLAHLLVEYESTKSSRYPYVPDAKPNQEMISRIALDIFPEFRQLEQTQRILTELLDSGLNDQ